MFSKSARYYDEIYTSIDKDYAVEADKAHAFIQQHKQTEGTSLLDVACGTGHHAGLLSKYYQVEGLDLEAQMLAIAKKKHPEIRFHQGDMLDFDLKDNSMQLPVCSVPLDTSRRNHGWGKRSGI